MLHVQRFIVHFVGQKNITVGAQSLLNRNASLARSASCLAQPKLNSPKKRNDWRFDQPISFQNQTKFCKNSTFQSFQSFWVNISLTWIKAIWGWFPLLTMISRARSQWGRDEIYPESFHHPHLHSIQWFENHMLYLEGLNIFVAQPCTVLQDLVCGKGWKKSIVKPCE